LFPQAEFYPHLRQMQCESAPGQGNNLPANKPSFRYSSPFARSESDRMSSWTRKTITSPAAAPAAIPLPGRDSAGSVSASAQHRPATGRNFSRALLFLSAWVLAVFTFLLIAMGGAVTSWNAGMSVPDWPTSFGSWAFIPVHLWADFAVLLEHNHRLMGAVSGLVAIGVFALAWRCFGLRSRTGILALAILLLYIVQGLFGGFRVTENSIPLAIVHGVLGQIILGMTILLLCWLKADNMRITPNCIKPDTGEDTTTSAQAISTPPAASIALGDSLAAPRNRATYSTWHRCLLLVLLGMTVLQLLLGTWVRQTQSAPAIPDAPAAYGQLIPPFDANEIQQRFREYDTSNWLTYAAINPELSMDAIYATQTPDLLANSMTFSAPIPTTEAVAYHFAHRVGAVVLLLLVLTLAYVLPARRDAFKAVRLPFLILAGLLVVQIVLGLSVIWSKENPKIATGHQAVGALFLAVAVWLTASVYHIAQQHRESSSSTDDGAGPRAMPT